MINMSTIHKCGRCIFRDQSTQVCDILKLAVQENDEACKRYADNETIVTCELCGRKTLGGSEVIFMEDKIHVTCAECANKTGTCATCINVKQCAFETDPSPIPQVVQKRIQQGPMVQIVQIMNPDRIAITCKMGCDCWDTESETCYKQTCGTCGKYKIVWE